VRVLANLVDNAIRYSPANSTVSIDVHREDSSVLATVDDEGPGVPPEVLPLLFAKFAKGRERSAGTGLGLYFCRITVERWGGGIGYEKRQPRGSRFWVRLPLAGS
jgi:K+-sensing histidine kinase KdpD